MNMVFLKGKIFTMNNLEQVVALIQCFQRQLVTLPKKLVQLATFLNANWSLFRKPIGHFFELQLVTP